MIITIRIKPAPSAKNAQQIVILVSVLQIAQSVLLDLTSQMATVIKIIQQLQLAQFLIA